MQIVNLSFAKDRRWIRKNHGGLTRRTRVRLASLKKQAHDRFRLAERKLCRSYLAGDFEAELKIPRPASGYDVI